MRFHEFDDNAFFHALAASQGQAAAAVKSGVAIGQREGERYRIALCAIVAAFDRACALGTTADMPNSIAQAIEQAKKALP